MPGELFMRLHSYGMELYRSRNGNEPIPWEKMNEIDLLITTCREQAKTDEERAIIVRTQAFWDVCFRKWYDGVPQEFEKEPEQPRQEVKKLQPGRIEKVAMFAVLVRNIRTLKSGRGLANTTSDDFHQLMKLIEQCSSIATRKAEKKVVRDALTTYEMQFKRWQELQAEKPAVPQNKPVSEEEFDSLLTDIDKLILSSHHKIIARKLGR